MRSLDFFFFTSIETWTKNSCWGPMISRPLLPFRLSSVSTSIRAQMSHLSNQVWTAHRKGWSLLATSSLSLIVIKLPMLTYMILFGARISSHASSLVRHVDYLSGMSMFLSSKNIVSGSSSSCFETVSCIWETWSTDWPSRYRPRISNVAVYYFYFVQSF